MAVSATPRPLYARETDVVPNVLEAGWAPGPVWTEAENLAPTGIRSPDRPFRWGSLYRLRYPGPRGKAISITYSVRVSVALVIQHAKRMHRILLPVAYPVLPYFSTLHHKRHDSRAGGGLLNTKHAF